MQTDTLLTAAELAERLNITIDSIYKSAAAGLIPSYKVGPKAGGLRFDFDEVRTALRRQTANHS